MISRLIPIVLILVAVGLFFGYINPTYTTKVQALRDEIKGYDAALDAAEQFENKRKILVDERNKIADDKVERVEAFLPDGVDNVQLILDLNALAERSGVELSDFDITVPGSDEDQNAGAVAIEAEEPYESLELSLTAIGSYSAFKTFLTGIEWSLRPLDLVELTIQDSQTGIYTYDLRLRIYWLR